MNSSPRGVHILSLDANGPLIFSQIAWLKHLQTQVGSSDDISQIFDIISGSSSSALLATMLTNQYRSFEDIETFFLTAFRQSLLPKYSSSKSISAYKNFISSENYSKLLKSFFHKNEQIFIPRSQYFNIQKGNFKNGRAMPFIIGVATINTSNDYIFRNFDVSKTSQPSSVNWNCSTMGLQVGIAPILYKQPISDSSLFLSDGSLSCPNPAKIAVSYSKLLYPDTPIDCLVSIGVNAKQISCSKTSGSFLGSRKKSITRSEWISKLQNSMKLSHLVDQGIAQHPKFAKNNYFRINFTVKKLYFYHFLSFSKDVAKILQVVAKKWFEDPSNQYIKDIMFKLLGRKLARPTPQDSDSSIFNFDLSCGSTLSSKGSYTSPESSQLISDPSKFNNVPKILPNTNAAFSGSSGSPPLSRDSLLYRSRSSSSSISSHSFDLRNQHSQSSPNESLVHLDPTNRIIDQKVLTALYSSLEKLLSVVNSFQGNLFTLLKAVSYELDSQEAKKLEVKIKEANNINQEITALSNKLKSSNLNILQSKSQIDQKTFFLLLDDMNVNMQTLYHVLKRVSLFLNDPEIELVKKKYNLNNIDESFHSSLMSCFSAATLNFNATNNTIRETFFNSKNDSRNETMESFSSRSSNSSSGLNSLTDSDLAKLPLPNSPLVASSSEYHPLVPAEGLPSSSLPIATHPDYIPSMPSMPVMHSIPQIPQIPFTEQTRSSIDLSSSSKINPHLIHDSSPQVLQNGQILYFVPVIHDPKNQQIPLNAQRGIPIPVPEQKAHQQSFYSNQYSSEGSSSSSSSSSGQMFFAPQIPIPEFQRNFSMPQHPNTQPNFSMPQLSSPNQNLSMPQLIQAQPQSLPSSPNKQFFPQHISSNQNLSKPFQNSSAQRFAPVSQNIAASSQEIYYPPFNADVTNEPIPAKKKKKKKNSKKKKKKKSKNISPLSEVSNVSTKSPTITSTTTTASTTGSDTYSDSPSESSGESSMKSIEQLTIKKSNLYQTHSTQKKTSLEPSFDIIDQVERYYPDEYNPSLDMSRTPQNSNNPGKTPVDPAFLNSLVGKPGHSVTQQLLHQSTEKTIKVDQSSFSNNHENTLPKISYDEINRLKSEFKHLEHPSMAAIEHLLQDLENTDSTFKTIKSINNPVRTTLMNATKHIQTLRSKDVFQFSTINFNSSLRNTSLCQPLQKDSNIDFPLILDRYIKETVDFTFDDSIKNPKKNTSAQTQYFKKGKYDPLTNVRIPEMSAIINFDPDNDLLHVSRHLLVILIFLYKSLPIDSELVLGQSQSQFGPKSHLFHIPKSNSGINPLDYLPEGIQLGQNQFSLANLNEKLIQFQKAAKSIAHCMSSFQKKFRKSDYITFESTRKKSNLPPFETNSSSLFSPVFPDLQIHDLLNKAGLICQYTVDIHQSYSLIDFSQRPKPRTNIKKIQALFDTAIPLLSQTYHRFHSIIIPIQICYCSCLNIRLSFLFREIVNNYIEPSVQFMQYVSKLHLPESTSMLATFQQAYEKVNQMLASFETDLVTQIVSEPAKCNISPSNQLFSDNSSSLSPSLSPQALYLKLVDSHGLGIILFSILSNFNVAIGSILSNLQISLDEDDSIIDQHSHASFVASMNTILIAFRTETIGLHTCLLAYQELLTSAE